MKESKSVCDWLVAGLQSDPTIDRPDTKSKPIQSLEERKLQLESIDYVDEVIVYDTEEDLENLIKDIKPDVRILGTDYKDVPSTEITGYEYCKIILYHERNHDWSTTDLKQRIKDDK